MEIDIRKSDSDAVNSIRICDESRSQFVAEVLVNRGCSVEIIDSHQDEAYTIEVTDKEHAMNLIKALHKAIELGWWKE